jgi:hypothetical protein
MGTTLIMDEMKSMGSSFSISLSLSMAPDVRTYGRASLPAESTQVRLSGSSADDDDDGTCFSFPAFLLPLAAVVLLLEVSAVEAVAAEVESVVVVSVSGAAIRDCEKSDVIADTIGMS